MGKPAVHFVNGLKPCCKCKKPLPPEAFHRTSGTISGRTSRCSECRQETCDKWTRNNPEKRRLAWQRWVKNNPRTRKNSLLLYQFGITIEEYERIEKLQNGLCAICKKQKRLCVDHDHKTGKVRGLLCDSCNTGLGKFADEISRLRSAANYLESPLESKP